MASDPKSKQHDDDSDEELMQVYDQLDVLSPDPFKPSPQTLDELVWVDEEVKNLKDSYFEPVVEEGSQVKEEEAMQNITSDPLSKDIGEKHKEVLDEVEHHTISPTKLRFNITLKKWHFGPHYVAFLPAKTVKELPRNKKVPVVLNSYGKIWNMYYNGHQKMKTLDCSGWKKFVVDNKLNVGDACFFEALENSPEKIVFKVMIKREDSGVEAVNGTSAEEPIVIVD